MPVRLHTKGDRMEVLPEAHRRSSKQCEPPEILQRRAMENEQRRSVRFRSDSTSSSSVIIIPISPCLPLFYSFKKGAVSLINFLPTESNYLGYPYVPNSLLYTLRARTREGPVHVRYSPIAPRDGFLHNIRPHLTAHPPVCTKIGFWLEKTDPCSGSSFIGSSSVSDCSSSLSRPLRSGSP